MSVADDEIIIELLDGLIFLLKPSFVQINGSPTIKGFDSLPHETGAKPVQSHSTHAANRFAPVQQHWVKTCIRHR